MSGSSPIVDVDYTQIEQRVLAHMIDGVLKAAAKRCLDYAVEHGVLAHWELHELGMKLIMGRGSHAVSRIVSWSELIYVHDANNLLELNEQRCLHALSS